MPVEESGGVVRACMCKILREVELEAGKCTDALSTNISLDGPAAVIHDVADQ